MSTRDTRLRAGEALKREDHSLSVAGALREVREASEENSPGESCRGRHSKKMPTAERAGRILFARRIAHAPRTFKSHRTHPNVRQRVQLNPSPQERAIERIAR
jgi:hypothetical protein